MKSLHLVLRAGAACSLLALATPAGAQSSLPNGVASGDVTSTSAVLWARASAAGSVSFVWSTDSGFQSTHGSEAVVVNDALVPAKVLAAGLAPRTRYYYRATDANGNASTGTFVTSGGAEAFRGLRFGVSGDWRGELAPYPSVSNASARALDFWISLGDTIYSDYPSPAVPLAQCQTVSEFRLKHNEVYSTRYGLNALADLRGSTSILASIDDHEVTNDFAGNALIGTDPRFTGNPTDTINTSVLYLNGIQAFHEFQPIAEISYPAIGDARTDGRPDLYRARTWNRDAAVIVTDARSFRDVGLPPVANPLDPSQVGAFIFASYNPSRSMLSTRQLSRIKADLASAQAAGVTWKFVVISEPSQNLGVLAASDRFEGYSAERADLMAYIEAAGIQNVVFVAADIHGTLVNNITYSAGPFSTQRPLRSFEVTTGSVAFDAPFGPTVASIAFGLGIPGALSPATYALLPGAQQEGYIQALTNQQIVPLGYSSLGLADLPMPVSILAGNPGLTATNSFGWTEFEISPVDQALTVTVYGIAPYSQASLDADPAAITSRTPSVRSQFRVVPDRCTGDFDRSGFIDADDFAAFIDAFSAGCVGLGQDVFGPNPACPRSADVNGSGFVDSDDFIDFDAAFVNGC